MLRSKPYELQGKGDVVETAWHRAVLLLACVACADSDGPLSSAESHRGSRNEPGVMYWKDEMTITIWHPQQISSLARDIDSYKKATKLRFDFSGVTDKELAALPTLPLVEIVTIFEEPAISDESLSVFARFPKLRVLYVERTAVTGKGFRYFSGEMRKKTRGACLEQLVLADNELTDEGLRDLARIITLNKLYISFESGTTVRGSLEHLPKLTRLQHLSLTFHSKERWAIDEERELLKRMPRCDVMFGVGSAASHSRIRYKTGSGDPFALPDLEHDAVEQLRETPETPGNAGKNERETSQNDFPE